VGIWLLFVEPAHSPLRKNVRRCYLRPCQKVNQIGNLFLIDCRFC
jgi:hypothetical protein